MELWHDPSSNHYFMLDQSQGRHFRSDQFGQPLPHFRLYDTGHLSPRDRSPPTHSTPKTPSLRPRTLYSGKFLGYCQYPRPRSYDASCTSSMRSSSVSPVTLPTPHRSPLPLLTAKTLETPKAVSIEGVKASLATPADTVIRTAMDFTHLMKQADKERGGFQPAPPREKRRSFKGAFQFLYPSAEERYRKDVELWRVTNPEAFRLQKRYDELDLKMLRKRRQQRMLKTKLELSSIN